MKKLLLGILSLLAIQNIYTHQTKSIETIPIKTEDRSTSLLQLILNEYLQHFRNNMAYSGAKQIKNFLHGNTPITPDSLNSMLRQLEHPTLLSSLLRYKSISTLYNKIISLIQNTNDKENLSPSLKTKLLAGLLSCLGYAGCSILGSLSYTTVEYIIYTGLFKIKPYIVKSKYCPA